MESYLYKHISGAATTDVCSEPSILHSLVINTTSAGAITIKDGSDIVAVIKASVLEQSLIYDITIQKTLTIITAGASDVTVCYRPN